MGGPVPRQHREIGILGTRPESNVFFFNALSCWRHCAATANCTNPASCSNINCPHLPLMPIWTLGLSYRVAFASPLTCLFVACSTPLPFEALTAPDIVPFCLLVPDRVSQRVTQPYESMTKPLSFSF